MFNFLNLFGSGSSGLGITERGKSRKAFRVERL
jgi:hypothetical protein